MKYSILLIIALFILAPMQAAPERDLERLVSANQAIRLVQAKFKSAKVLRTGAQHLKGRKTYKVKIEDRGHVRSIYVDAETGRFVKRKK